MYIKRFARNWRKIEFLILSGNKSLLKAKVSASVCGDTDRGNTETEVVVVAF